MQFTFEFECPELSGFIKKAGEQPSRFELDPDNLNDQWFMISHNRQTSQSDLISDQKSTEERPVVRISLISSRENEEYPLCKDLELYTSEQAPIAQNLPPNNNLFKRKEASQPGNRRENILTKTSNNEHKQKLQKVNRSKMESKNKKETSSEIITRSKSGLQSKFKSTDRWPCPFSTKLQRKWKNKYGAKWYDLSPKTREEAARAMKQMKQSQQELERSQIARKKSQQK